jgi:subtilisin family serine protease
MSQDNPIISFPWWQEKVQLSHLRNLGLYGTGIKVAILDTGVVYPHPGLKLDPTLFSDVTKSKSGYIDILGHGTHCLGIIAASELPGNATGIAPQATCFVGKITKDDYGDMPGYLAVGIDWAVSRQVDIISISNGNPNPHDKVKSAIQSALNAGILVVAAAGNKVAGFPDDHIYYPARFDNVLSVGGLDSLDEPLNDSLLTGETDIFAPGKEIESTHLNDQFVRLSGSSQATPVVAAISALLLEYFRRDNPRYQATDLRELIIRNGNPAKFGKIINIQNIT